MEDISHGNHAHIIRDLARILTEHNGVSVTALDMTKIHTWTDYFILASVTSSTHMRGLLKHVKDFILERGIETYRRSPTSDEEEWILVDCGWFVVHLMSAKAREFYDLEKLWFEAVRL